MRFTHQFPLRDPLRTTDDHAHRHRRLLLRHRNHHQHHPAGMGRCHVTGTGVGVVLLLLFLWSSSAAVVDVSGGEEKQPSVVRIGFLATHAPLARLMMGAVPLAVDEVNRDTNLLPGHVLNYTMVDAGPAGTSMAIKHMTRWRDEGVMAFVGPDETCMSEALVAAAWNIPMITYKCSDRRVSDKSIFPTFARTLPTSSKVSKFVIALLQRFKWDHVTVIVEENSAWKQIAEALEGLAEETKVTIQSVTLLRDFVTSNLKELEDILRDTYKRTRVYVFLGEQFAVVQFALEMYRKKLLQTGEYVIISVDDDIYNETRPTQYMYSVGEDQDIIAADQDVVSAFQSVLKITPHATTNPDFPHLMEKVKDWMSEGPLNVPTNKIISIAQVPIYGAYAYDAVMVYAKALTKLLKLEQDPRNGTAIIEQISGQLYDSVRGYMVHIDENGDSEGNYTVLALVKDDALPAKWRMKPVGGFDYKENSSTPEFNLHPGSSIAWVKGSPPLAVPVCGFDDENCVYKPEWKMVAICTVCALVLVIGATFAFRHYRYEHKLACLLWKIEMKDITIIPTDSDQILANKSTICRSSIFGTVAPETTSDLPLYVRAYTKIGFYKGTIVGVRPVHKKSIDLTRSIRKELKQVRDLRHENLVPFIGACVDPGNICIVTAYCARGSLEDVLQNEDLDLDNMFVASLVADLIKGMIYLHESEIGSHGNLKPANCLVDSRWVLQITDYGLHEFKGTSDNRLGCGHVYHKKLLWRAPEFLRDQSPPSRGSPKGDVYSFGLILYEIIGRAGPWGNIDYSTKEIIERVAYPAQYGNKLFRPVTQELNCSDYIVCCMLDCWSEDPDDRPDFRFIRIKLKEMQAGLKSNIFDNMIAIMEKYAYNLEGLVQERTHQLMEEKKKTDALLHRMLPKSVAEQLKRGEQVVPESFDSVTIYFSDIVGFTALSAESTPFQVVDLLNDLYTTFDSIIGNYDVYKVETIGDAYMVVSGLPIRNGDLHAGEIARLGLHLLQAIKNFEIRHQPGELLKLRIGIHSGPCAAGVVGMKMPRYCLFGDTVNTASRMESSGKPLKIHVSEACKTILDKLGGFQIEDRGLVPIKGKGEMRTFWLNEMENYNPLKALKKADQPAGGVGGGGGGGESPLLLAVSPHHFPPIGARKMSTSLPRIVECHESSSEGGGAADNNNSMTTTCDTPASSLPGSPTLSARRCLLNSDHHKTTNGVCFKYNQLLSNNGGNGGGYGDDKYPNNYVSCSNVFQECKNNILKELRRNGHSLVNRYRSAPTIDLRNENFV